MNMISSTSTLRCFLLISFFISLIECFALTLPSVTNATTYYSDYGQSRTHNILVTMGSHNFQVDGIAINKNTEWYVNGVYTGESENDWSGILAIDPEYTRNISGNIKIEAIVYNSSWVFEENHTWNITAQLPQVPPTTPGTISASNVTQTSARVSWGASSDQNGDSITYYVEYQKDDLNPFWQAAGSTTATYKNLSGLTADKDYHVRVRAYDGKDYSSWRSQNDVFHTLITRILSAYWWAPLDVSVGDEATMCAEVENIPVGTQCTFKVFEDDVIDDDEVSPAIAGTVYSAEEGKTYVKATWTAQWQNDGGINPWAGDPEHFFEVTCSSVSLKSSKQLNKELIVRKLQQPSATNGDFAYWDDDEGEATREATVLSNSRIPIILVHGMSGDAKYDSLNYWYGWINGDMNPENAQLGRFNENDMKNKFKVYRYVYDSSQKISTNGSEFAQFINQYFQQHAEFAERQIVIMAHSMGGLVARYAFNTDNNFRNKVHRLITLGSPHLGSPLANPTWIRNAYPDIDYAGFVISTLYDAMRVFGKVEGHPGFFDLAWYNINDIPNASRIGLSHYLWLITHPGFYDITLLNNSLTNPFCGSTNMMKEDWDERITAYGGFTSNLIIGNGETWPETVAEEVNDDHKNLLLAMNLMYPMTKQDGSIIGNNDGLVPLSSALLGTAHTKVEKINLTQSLGEPIDHSTYLDVPSTMDIIANRLLTMVKVSISSQPEIDSSARWRVTGGAWQKFGVSLNALKPGQYTIEFKDVPGWTKPPNKTVEVFEGATTEFSAAYIPLDSQLPTVTINSPTSNPTYSTSSGALTIGGTASDNVGVTQVTWSNSQGASGICSGTNTWSASGIALSSGANVITVTARDAAGNSGTDTLTVTYTPTDVQLPTVTINSPTSNPTYSTSSGALTIGGTASDNVGVTQVSWINSQGGSGTCSGTNSWSATGITLFSGTNIITVTARDAVGNVGTDMLTVTYTANRPPVLDPIGAKSVDENEQLEFTVTATDPDNDNLSFSASNLPTGANFDPVTQIFSWTPVSGDAGNYIVQFTVTDNGSPTLNDSEEIGIEVNESLNPQDDTDTGGGGGEGCFISQIYQ